MNKSTLSKYGFFFVSIILVLISVRGINNTLNSLEYIQEKSIYPGSPFESSLTRARYAQTMALVENNTFSLSPAQAILAAPDTGYFNGKFYSLFAPGISIISYIPYKLGAIFNNPLLFIFIFLSAFLIANYILIYKISKKIGLADRSSIIAALSFTFGSTAWVYATTAITQHNVTTFLLLLIIYSSLGDRPKYLVGGMAYAAGLIVDYPNAIILFPSLFFLASKAISLSNNSNFYTLAIKKSILLIPVGLALFTIPHLYYNYINFGSPISIANNVLVRIKNIDQIKDFVTFSIEPEKAMNIVQFDYQRLSSGINLLIFSKNRGLLFFSPILLFGMFGVTELYKRNKLLAISLLSTSICTLLLYSSFNDPWGGWVFGPRYLIPVMSCLSIFLACFLENAKHVLIKVALLIALIYSVAIQLVGILTTSQLPADIEAIPAGLDYTYTQNFEMMLNGMNTNFVYQKFLSSYINSFHFFLILLLTISIPTAFLLFTKTTNKK